MSDRFGATPEEWITFDVLLGLTRDILPVVSNPFAKIAVKSKMAVLGKTPSIYNKNFRVTGFGKWTKYEANSQDIQKWSENPNYGICIQTREVRAIDIDMEESAPVVALFTAAGLQLPKRKREGSGKCLLAFRLKGQFAKRVITCADGIIEFLANGQQFVACGTHPSKTRYEWEGGLPEEIPELSIEVFERLWKILVKRFAVEVPTEESIRKDEADIVIHDPVLDKLEVLSWGNDKQAFITCPFKHEHSMDSGETETAYFPAGTRGYQQGHFVCLHAHCAKRTDEDFISALRLVEDEFDVLPVEEKKLVIPISERSPEEVARMFRRTKKGILPVIYNLNLAFSHPLVCGMQITYDTFKDEVMYAPPGTNMQWQRFGDNQYSQLQLHLETGQRFQPLAFDLIRRTVDMVAHENTFDSAILWLESLEWDGVPRIGNFMHEVMGTEDTQYAEAISLYMWSALAGRVMSPGVKADMMIIFQGEEGIYKSSVISSLVPSEDYFIELQFDEKDADLARKMRGKLVIEIAELRGLNTKDKESIKAFVVRRFEEWVPKFKEKSIIFARRAMLFGTTNDDDFLSDEGKKRRWLPIKVGKVNLDKLIKDRLQMWAEGRELFLREGIQWKNAENLAPEEHGKFMLFDPWQDYIQNWMTTVDELEGLAPISSGYLRLPDVLRGALQMDARNIRGGESKRVARVLRSMGFENITKRIGEKTEKVWALKKPELKLVK